MYFHRFQIGSLLKYTYLKTPLHTNHLLLFTIDTLFNGLNDFIKGKTKEFFWENGKKGDDSNACITFKFIHKDGLGHILIEVYMELDDGGNYSSHNCCFYLNTEIGLLEKFCQKLPTLKRELLGIEVVLNDND